MGIHLDDDMESVNPKQLILYHASFVYLEEQNPVIYTFGTVDILSPIPFNVSRHCGTDSKVSGKISCTQASSILPVYD